MATYILTIGGVERPLKVDSLDLRKVIAGVDVMNCIVPSKDAAYRPALGAVVELTEDGTPIFGGTIKKTEETGLDGSLTDDIGTEIFCVGYGEVFERVHITETFPAGTSVEDIADALVTNYLGDYGITLDAGQVTGPSLTKEIAADGMLLSQFFELLLTNLGYAPQVNSDKEFILYEPGTDAAAYDVVDGDGNHRGDIRVIRSKAERYNRIIVRYGENVVRLVEQPYTGDGSTDTFPVDHPIQGPFPVIPSGAVGYGVIRYTGSTESIATDPAGGFIWEYDPVANEITRSLGAVANGVDFVFPYDVQFPQVVTAEDAADIAADGPSELVIELPNVYSKALAQEQAESYLNKYLSNPVDVEYDTLGLGLEPGTAQTITAADRNVSGSFLITEVHARILAGSNSLIRSIKTIGGDEFKGSFRDLYKAWLGGGTTTVSSTYAPVVPPTTPYPLPSAGSLIGVQRITATGSFTYTATAGTRLVVMELVGGGGGGSGIASPGSGKVSIGRSGGGGGYIRKLLSSAFNGGTGSVGAGGPGGSAGDNAGTAGGNTTFTIVGGGTTYTAGGGDAGNNGGSALAVFPNISNGVGGGSASGGDINIPGSGSFAGVVQSATILNSGGGGYSHLGHGGYGSLVVAGNSFQAAFNGTGNGGGGGSPVATGTAGAQAGGNGSNGIAIFTEYA